ncbi:MAG: RNA-binding protein [Lachnospiraceae bacterium]|jgi:predicted RNA-binding protein (virulence factor B family)|nr:RNA-binding protein [Lachnospiraceae bacterium]
MSLEENLGKKIELKVNKLVEFGAYLYDGKDKEDIVLLPKKQVPEDIKLEDTIEVFLYKDSSDRLIATVNEPLLTLGEVARLKVKEVSKIGAFLDMGLERDLFLPFKEQVTKVKEGDEVIVALYVDHTKRLAGTMKVYEYLKGKSLYRRNDKVSGTVFSISEKFGYFLCIDLKYLGRIKNTETNVKYHLGDEVTGRVIDNLPDGKLEISTKKTIAGQMKDDSDLILERLKQEGGVLHLTDKSNPKEIEKQLGISKNAFKRAIGRLYKEEKIELNADNIKIKAK